MHKTTNRKENHSRSLLAFSLAFLLLLGVSLGMLRSTPSSSRLAAEGYFAGMGQVAKANLAQAREQAREVFGKLPLYFVENQGQADEQVAYYLPGSDTSIYFTAQGVTFGLTAPAEETDQETPEIRPASFDLGGPDREPPAARQRWTVMLDFVGANSEARPVGREHTEAVVSYFKGPQENWKTGVATYAQVVYEDLWPGIDVVYSGRNGRLKADFLVHPGADPQQIRLAYRGASAVEINAIGQLEVVTPAGTLTEDAPYAYQDTPEGRREVAARFVITEQTGDAVFSGFQVDYYDPALPLVLDPVVLLYAGFIGGFGGERGRGIAVDSAGSTYVTGSAYSDLPVTVGPDLTYNGELDAFVAKVRADGTGLQYAGYIGGIKNDIGYGIAVDSAGNAYVTGFAGSTEATFPVTEGPDLTYNGRGDIFVVKVNASGTALDYAGFIGGSDWEEGHSIAVDSSGNAYVTGFTESTEATFPATVGPDLTANGNYDIFVAKVNASGTALDYAGYIGGPDYEQGDGIAVDSLGSAYVTGWARSFGGTIPVKVGPDLSHNGSEDAFVLKVNPSGTALEYSGFIGGSSNEKGSSVAVDSAGNAYVTGFTQSREPSFPVKVGPDLTYNGGVGTREDAFVAKVNPPGTALVYAGYIGGLRLDIGYGIAVDSSGAAYVTGLTESNEATFPVTVGPDLTWNSTCTRLFCSEDAFVAKVNPLGTGLEYAGYIGGSGDEEGYGIAVDSTGNAYVTGWTSSTEASFPVTVGPDLTSDGSDVFVAKVGEPCTLNMELNHSPGALTMNFELGTGTLGPARWEVWLISILGVKTLWTVPLPRIDPVVSFPVSFPFPNLGNIGILTTLMQGSSGIVCSDWKTIHTGGIGASIQQLEEMLSRSGISGK